MFRLIPFERRDDWGSTTAIPRFLGKQVSATPVSELWFGTHPDGPTGIETVDEARAAAGVESALGGVGRPGTRAAGVAGVADAERAEANRSDHAGVGAAGGVEVARDAATPTTLQHLIEADPEFYLGKGIMYSFGPTLPFLAKLIAPGQALSLQVHPTKEIAREGFLREQALGIPRDDPHRTYRDMNHKPEMLFALTNFEALVGFRVPRKARALLHGLEGTLADSLRRRLQLSTVRGGLQLLVGWLFDEDSPATPDAINQFARSCQARLDSGTSPSVRTDRLITQLATRYPGDPGVIVAFLMNPVSLRPGEVVAIPPRQIHSYQSGLGIEIMANSDNVVRAGLTHKYVDSAQLVEIAEFSALPPVRIAPEHPLPNTDRFLAQAQEFTLAVTTVGKNDGAVPTAGEGPRILIGVEGEVRAQVPENAGSTLREMTIKAGDAVFVGAHERHLTLEGDGRVVECAAP